MTREERIKEYLEQNYSEIMYAVKIDIPDDLDRHNFIIAQSLAAQSEAHKTAKNIWDEAIKEADSYKYCDDCKQEIKDCCGGCKCDNSPQCKWCDY